MSEKLPVAVDAMGGDNAPSDVVEGALLAFEKFGVPVLLVGDSKKIGSSHGLEVVEASQVIEMGAEPASSVRRLKDSSIVRTAELVRDGKASSMLSAGNTGAAMAASLLRLGRIKGASRPAIAVPLPVADSTPTLLLDCGANADCVADWFVQFGVMGAAYLNHHWGVPRPRVSLLTIGEEAGKGNELVKKAADLLQSYDWDAIGAEFIGNVEGYELLSDAVDVVICDGFTGNTVLKSLEGLYAVYTSSITKALTSVSDDFCKEAMEVVEPVIDIYDPFKVATGVLLGVKGVSMIAHGSSSPMTIARAIKTADELSQNNLPDRLRSAFAAV